jgi:hypothetical protein
MRSGWREAITKLPDIGDKLGTTENPGPVIQAIGKAKAIIFENDPTGLKAFNDAMDLTGAGDHPDIFKGWYKVAQRVIEGTHVSGKGPAPEGQAAPNKAARPSVAQSLYPNLPTSH